MEKRSSSKTKFVFGINTKLGIIIMSYLDAAIILLVSPKITYQDDWAKHILMRISLPLIWLIFGLSGQYYNKPNLLITYFIYRIIFSIVISAVMVDKISANKYELNRLGVDKSIRTEIERILTEPYPGESPSVDQEINATYIKMIFEALLIVLQMYFMKVVITCWRDMRRDSLRRQADKHQLLARF